MQKTAESSPDTLEGVRVKMHACQKKCMAAVTQSQIQSRLTPSLPYECRMKQRLEVFNATTASLGECVWDAQHGKNVALLQPGSPESLLSLLLLLVANPYPRFQATSLTRPKTDARAARAMVAPSRKGANTVFPQVMLRWHRDVGKMRKGAHGVVTELLNRHVEQLRQEVGERLPGRRNLPRNREPRG